MKGYQPDGQPAVDASTSIVCDILDNGPRPCGGWKNPAGTHIYVITTIIKSVHCFVSWPRGKQMVKDKKTCPPLLTTWRYPVHVNLIRSTLCSKKPNTKMLISHKCVNILISNIKLSTCTQHTFLHNWCVFVYLLNTLLSSEETKSMFDFRYSTSAQNDLQRT